MKLFARVCMGASVPCVILCAAIASAQMIEETVVAVEEAGPEELQAGETAIYGEVQAVDAAAGTIDMQYYDYDSDSEKALTVAVPASAALENVASLAGIRKGDWADIVYVSKDGKNTATIVTVEKEEIEEDFEAVEVEEAAPVE